MSTTSIESVEDPNSNPSKPIIITFDDVKRGYQSLQGIVVRTPLIKSRLDQIVDMDVYLKLENMQTTGSFKDRGARYALRTLTPEQKFNGAVSCSTGNHSSALCYHGLQLGIPITIVMPKTATLYKIEKCKKVCDNLILYGDEYAEAKALACSFAKHTGKTYISGYDYPQLIAGQGSAGIEIFEELADIDAIIIPCGGGGLIASVSAILKDLSPKTEVIGVESENVPGFSTALKAGKPVRVQAKPTIADGLAVSKAGYNSFATVKKHGVKRIITVSEDTICVAIQLLLENEKITVEGAGAAPLAAILSGQLSDLNGKRVVLVCTGGNISIDTLLRASERGLTGLGRCVKFYVHLLDKPGSLAQLCSDISKNGATIRYIHTDPAWVNDDFTCKVYVKCECANIEQALKLNKTIEDNYKKVQFENFPNACMARFLTSQKK